MQSSSLSCTRPVVPTVVWSGSSEADRDVEGAWAGPGETSRLKGEPGSMADCPRSPTCNKYRPAWPTEYLYASPSTTALEHRALGVDTGGPRCVEAGGDGGTCGSNAECARDLMGAHERAVGMQRAWVEATIRKRDAARALGELMGVALAHAHLVLLALQIGCGTPPPELLLPPPLVILNLPVAACEPLSPILVRGGQPALLAARRILLSTWRLGGQMLDAHVRAEALFRLADLMQLHPRFRWHLRARVRGGAVERRLLVEGRAEGSSALGRWLRGEARHTTPWGGRGHTVSSSRDAL